jgi:predicted transcriptional regulator
VPTEKQINAAMEYERRATIRRAAQGLARTELVSRHKEEYDELYQKFQNELDHATDD